MKFKHPILPADNGTDSDQTRRLLWVLATATFVIFFQAFMVAPLIPHLSGIFDAPLEVVGWAVPAYLIPYGFATLAYGLLSDRLGRKNLVLGSMLALIILNLATATAQDEWQFLAWRLATGIGAAAVVPLTLTLIGDLFPFERCGKPLGLIFAALAGGIAAGKTMGVLVVPFIGWRGLFIAVAVAAILVFLPMLWLRRGLGGVPDRPPRTVSDMRAAFRKLLSTTRGKATYSYVLLNSIFHGGVYTWLGVYFAQRYGLGEIGIALAIIGYGIPGFLFARAIGRTADRWGRRWLIPLGLLISSASALGFIPVWGVVVAAVMVLVLSVGFDLTQPLFAGIVTDLGGKKHGGQAMGLNVFLLFNGFGLGAFLFGELLRFDFNTALAIFAAGAFLLLLGSLWLFRGERPQNQRNLNMSANTENQTHEQAPAEATPSPRQELESLRIKVGGMSCSFCTETIRKAYGGMEGVQETGCRSGQASPSPSMAGLWRGARVWTRASSPASPCRRRRGRAMRWWAAR